MPHNVEINFGVKNLVIETGKLAKQANGAVMIQHGGTVVLVTAVMSKEPKEDISFFPLTAEYQEKTYAAGKIPGGFFKREGRPSEKEILTARLIDRPIRPLFPKGFLNEVQIVAIVLSSDGENDPDILACIGASSALSISDIPFKGPVGTVRIGRIDNEFVINPTYAQLDKSTLDLVVAGTKDSIIMIEAGAQEISEELIVEAIQFGHLKIKEVIQAQEKLISLCGKKKADVVYKAIDKELLKKVRVLALEKLSEVNRIASKEAREELMDSIAKDIVEKLTAENPEYLETDITSALIEVEKAEVRKQILEKGIRVDGRNCTTIRPITCDVSLLPRTHGSGLFTRGQTQSLSVATLGTSDDEQRVDALEGETQKSFMLHYNFPPFSVGEVRPMRGPGRREIGHGALAARGLKPVMPSKEEFPYTVRVVSDILESNGSSSMATVCAGTLSLMDAGVPIKAAVSGVAMGLVKGDDKIAILTDISGLEDHFGDMDFKIIGTKKGVTALQLDIKIEGVDISLISKALLESRPQRLYILDKILETISAPRKTLSIYAPRILILKINPDKIREVIGPGGKTIKKIIDETGVTIDIEDTGRVLVASADNDALNRAVDIIKGLTEDVEVGKVYLGKIKRITNFGAFCEILPGKEGLIHISELSNKFVEKVEDEVSLGEEVSVKVIEIDSQGRINLSRKQIKDESSQSEST
ncbi:MAG: polyribonucleotide nucleotidyltransferase [Candidatus Omnitrophota bacterium]